MSSLQWQNSLVRLVVSDRPGWYFLSIRVNRWIIRAIQVSPPALLPWGDGKDNTRDMPTNVEVSFQIPIGHAFSLAGITNPGIDPAGWPKWAELAVFHENHFEAPGQNEPVEQEVVAPQSTTPIPPRPCKGSQLRLRQAVNERAAEFEAAIICNSVSLSSFGPEKIIWKSPLATEQYAEYQDDVLDHLGLQKHQQSLRQFWPPYGPVWDGLAVLQGPENRTGVLLVEAKAHPEEAVTTCGATAITSLSKIHQAFARTQGYMGIEPRDWTKPYYQLANRLAFLYFFNVILNVPTWLVLGNFVDDVSHKPTPITAWRGYQPQMFRELGIHPECRMLDRLITVHSPCHA